VDLHTLTPAQRRLLVAVVVLGALLVVGVPRLLHRGGGGHAAIPVLRAPRAARSAVGGPAKVVVDVAGAVRRPGLHALASGTRIADAVAAAGGATAKADLAAVNLAAPIADGEQIVVPARVPGVGAVAAGAGGTPSPTAPLDLNTATLEQLDALPGIGPTTAQKILDYRQAHGSFHTVDELDAVPGIGQGRIAQLKGLVIP
jgi:competence protein ComEA